MISEWGNGTRSSYIVNQPSITHILHAQIVDKYPQHHGK